MALGEYVSVSSQRDAQTTLIAKERMELRDEPEAELEELTGLYEERGLTPATARQVAVELTEHDALAAHLVRRAQPQRGRRGQRRARRVRLGASRSWSAA